MTNGPMSSQDQDRWRTLAAMLFGALLIGFGLVPWWLGGLIGGAALIASWIIWPTKPPDN